MEAKYYRPITKTLFFAALGLLLFMTSCKKEHDGLLRADMASFSVNNNQKAYIDAQLYNCFEIGEKVRVNNSTGNVAALERNDRQCDISGVPSATNYYAFYPSVLLADQSVDLSSGVNGKGVTLPRVQEYKYVNGHQSIQNPMAAELLNAGDDNYTLHFHNLCALFKVNINTLAAFDSIKISINYSHGQKHIYLSGAGTVVFSTTGDYNNRKITMNNSDVFTDVTLALPQGHTGKRGGESFYIVVPAFKIENSGNNSLILEIKNGNRVVRKYKKDLNNGNEILANHIYTLGTFKFDVGLFSVRNGKTVIFAPGNLQWSYTGGGTTPTTHNTNGNIDYRNGTWRFAEHQYDFIGSGNVNAHGRDVTGNDYGARVYSNIFDENYNGWIDFFSWGGSGYGTTRPYYYNNSSSEKCYCTDNSLSNYDWGTFNTIYNPKTKENDPCGTWYTLSAAEWEYVLTQRGQFWENTDHPWWMFNLVKIDRGADYIYGLILYPDTTLDCPIQSIETNWKPRNNLTAQYTITQAEYDILEAFGCVFLPSAGRMAYGLDANNPMQIHDPNKHGGYWASDAGTISPHWIYVNEGAFGLKHGDAGGGVSLNTALMSVRLAHVVKDVSANISD